MASPDGQVILFNASNVLQPIPATSLQRQSSAPNLPVWLTPVGQTYRYETARGDASDIAIQFLYFSRDVPGVDESLLQIFYFDTNRREGEWTALDTLIDPVRNQASAKTSGDGYYVLVATVEMPQVFEGWNLIGNPIAGSVPVTDALSSLGTITESGYSIIYGFNESTQSWQAYDPGQNGKVNTLAELTFGQGYWIYIEREAPFFFPIAGEKSIERSSTQIVPVDRTAALEPPAIIFGQISVESDSTITPTSVHIARVDAPADICGEGTISQSESNSFEFILYAEKSFESCRLDESVVVTILIDGEDTGKTVIWDNKRMTNVVINLSD